MKTDLILKRMMLLGFMLMAVSINVFANNTDEEKNSVSRNGENSLVISVNPNVTDPYVMEIEEGAQGSIMIVPPAGYTCDPDVELEQEDNYITMHNNNRGLVLTFTANGEGIAYLYVRVLVVDGYGRAILITIIINVRR